MKNKKPNVLSFRVTSELMEAVLERVDSGNYKSRSDMISELFSESFQKYLTTEENAQLVRNEKQ